MFSLAAISRMHDANTARAVKRVPSVKSIEAHFTGLDEDGAAQIRCELRESDDVITTLHNVSEILDAYGVEYLHARNDDEYVRGVNYVNVGDTYAPTVIFDQVTRTFRLTTIGDVLELASNASRFGPGPVDEYY